MEILVFPLEYPVVIKYTWGWGFQGITLGSVYCKQMGYLLVA